MVQLWNIAMNVWKSYVIMHLTFAKFSEKLGFFTSWYEHVSGGKKG